MHAEFRQAARHFFTEKCAPSGGGESEARMQPERITRGFATVYRP